MHSVTRRRRQEQRQQEQRLRPRKWSTKYKKSIDCSAPRGFSQRQYCKYGRRR